MLVSRCLSLIFVCVVVTCNVVVTASDDDERPPPNVVLILADDLGYGDLRSVSGHPTSSTPNLDKLARASKVMHNFYAAYPWCSPSREVVDVMMS